MILESGLRMTGSLEIGDKPTQACFCLTMTNYKVLKEMLQKSLIPNGIKGVWYNTGHVSNTKQPSNYWKLKVIQAASG
jgi:hypothetical protein